MTNQKNRVCRLYRVPTIGQVEKDDIPMQKQSCREFCDRQGWTVVNEFSEKGASGFKASARTGMLFRKFNVKRLRVPLTFCWYSCLTV